MRYFGNTHTPAAPVTPDTVLSKLLTAGTAEVFDFPTTCDLFRVSGGSTAAGIETFFLNVGSTKASLPTTAHITSTQGSSEFNIPIGIGEGRIYQRARGTTGFSVVSPSSMYFCVEYWKRDASTST